MHAVRYTNLLLLQIIRSPERELTLMSAAPLPRVPDLPEEEVPPFDNVVNRLKVMSNLDPVTYKLPHRGRIELAVCGEPYDVEVVFDDTADNRACEIRIKKV